MCKPRWICLCHICHFAIFICFVGVYVHICLSPRTNKEGKLREKTMSDVTGAHLLAIVRLHEDLIRVKLGAAGTVNIGESFSVSLHSLNTSWTRRGRTSRSNQYWFTKKHFITFLGAFDASISLLASRNQSSNLPIIVERANQFQTKNELFPLLNE